MRILSLVWALAFAPTASALAAAPVPYVFKGLVEYGSGPGNAPVGARQGAYITVTIILDSSAVGTLNGNTVTYQGGYACGPQTSPVLSATINGQTTNYANGSCDSFSITRNASGTSSITMGSGSTQIGTTFTASFVTSNSNVISSFALPAKIHTVNFDRSMFHFSVPSFNISGDLSGK